MKRIWRLLMIPAAALLLMPFFGTVAGAPWTGAALGLAGLAALLIAARTLQREYVEPAQHLDRWLERKYQFDGEPALEFGRFVRVQQRIDSLVGELRHMRDLLDDDDLKQTRILAQKSRSLQVLYDVAASINIFNDLDDLLTRFLHTLIDVVKAQSATVRLLDKEDSSLRLVAAVGLDDNALLNESRKLVAVDDITVDVEQSPSGGEHDGQSAAENLQSLTVPLRYHGKTLGVYNLVVEQTELDAREDIQDLLTSIGRHLGMAIEKVRVDHQAQRLQIMQERNQLAHELHDSLAQTLASLRFQVKMMDDTLRDNGSMEEARREAARVKRHLDEANRELRDLVSHFRVPLDARGLIPALDDMVTRFRQETGIATFFQRECDAIELPASHEVHMVRIIQEALANVRKHSQAKVVRILVSCHPPGYHRVLIEDDGVGLPEVVDEAEHFGLSILRERVASLGGDIAIDSEPGEGTRIEVSFHYEP